MYVYQTYLGFFSKLTNFHVYFLTSGNESSRHNSIHHVFLSRAVEFGLSFYEEDNIDFPVSSHNVNILGDVYYDPNSSLQEFYENKLNIHLPGMLICKNPIDQKLGISGAFYVSFKDTKHPFKEAKRLVDDLLMAKEENQFFVRLSSLNKVYIIQPKTTDVGLNLNTILAHITKM